MLKKESSNVGKGTGLVKMFNRFAIEAKKMQDFMQLAKTHGRNFKVIAE